MSSKRTRSFKTFSENPILIQDEEAMERFDSIFKNQPMMLEKGFNLESNDKVVMPLPIRKTINALNWEQFCDACSMLDENLLREFYANSTTSDANEVSVRKKMIPLTSKSINDLFNLPDVEEDEYSTMMMNINWDFLQQVLKVVINLGSQRIIRKYESDGSSTKSKPKSPEPRVEPNVAEPVEQRFNLELSIPTSSNVMNKSEFSTMMDM
ncbi:hypothetical protein PVK06_010285 [Gossypium arboreum]|uniref:Uncharacterized protein n=1 Tax=Gossypium arboreum TaxID=29729 RepID=A0ABR0Q5J6_GOSAR|nr:hypothetical protein PVK06_010285 [Gossypium arboreum]